jgi:Phenylalanyl-tRNA synthetase alpha subunit
MNMEQQIQTILNEAKQVIPQIVDFPTWQVEKSKFLGKQGPLASLMQGLKDITIEERKAIGMLTNQAKVELEAMFDQQRLHIESIGMQERLAKESIDVTLPGHGVSLGSVHPLIK